MERDDILRVLRDEGVDLDDREAVYHALRDRGYDEVADYLSSVPPRRYRTFIDNLRKADTT